ncbi:MAG: fumarylacetoacetate hydrolase family protein [Thermoplasmatota archaeon]
MFWAPGGVRKAYQRGPSGDFVKLCTYDAGAGPRTGLVRNQMVVDLHAADPGVPQEMKALVAGGNAMLERIRGQASACTDRALLARLADVKLLPPVTKPGRYLDFYSFEQHVKTARAKRGLEVVPEWYQHPTYYNGNPYSFVGPEGRVVFPAGETQRDYELELAVVIGRPARDIQATEWASYVAGYTILNDWSSRAIQMSYAKIGMGPSAGKDFATGIGPWIVTQDECPEPAKIEMAARVNGKEWSRGFFGATRYDWGAMLSFATKGADLLPGDVVGSGTFGGGCGYELDRFLQPGDAVEMDLIYEAKVLGSLRQRVAG